MFVCLHVCVSICVCVRAYVSSLEPQHRFLWNAMLCAYQLLKTLATSKLIIHKSPCCHVVLGLARYEEHSWCEAQQKLNQEKNIPCCRPRHWQHGSPRSKAKPPPTADCRTRQRSQAWCPCPTQELCSLSSEEKKQTNKNTQILYQLIKRSTEYFHRVHKVNSPILALATPDTQGGRKMIFETFAERTVSEWCSLLEAVVTASSINCFKSCLDPHWQSLLSIFWVLTVAALSMPAAVQCYRLVSMYKDSTIKIVQVQRH